MNDFKKVKKLYIDDKLMRLKWLAGHNAKNSENASWVNEAAIYKHMLKVVAKAWWSVVRHRIDPTTNNNTLGLTNVGLVSTLISMMELNIS